MITVSVLNEIGRIRHGFFTREGGVSNGLYASLNCGLGSGDDPARVAQNRAIAMAMLDAPPAALATLYQMHSPAVVTVDRPWPVNEAPRADAMVTATPGIVLGVLTADCAPVLLADAEAGVIAAIHAGWRGALAGVVAATVASMRALGGEPGRIVAAVGPCISHRSYEVGDDFHAPFVDQDPTNIQFFSLAARPGHQLFDLVGYVSRCLARAGVTQVMRTPADTVRDEKRFYSYRRATLRGESDYGRQLSAILLER